MMANICGKRYLIYNMKHSQFEAATIIPYYEEAKKMLKEILMYLKYQ